MELIRESSNLYGKERRKMAIFKCEFCNNEFELRRDKGLKQKSCLGCRGTKHGMSRTRQYSIWQGMNRRCTDSTRAKYHLYGGKGITVCEKWKTFEGFWEDWTGDAYSFYLKPEYTKFKYNEFYFSLKVIISGVIDDATDLNGTVVRYHFYNYTSDVTKFIQCQNSK